MINLPDLLESVAQQIRDAIDVRTADYFPEDINPPFVFLALDTLKEAAFGFESYSVTVNAVLLVAATDARTGQRLVYQYLDPSTTSLPSACAGLTLTGVSCTPGEFRSLGIEEVALYQYYGGLLPLQFVVT